jgi:hypothetical protein
MSTLIKHLYKLVKEDQWSANFAGSKDYRPAGRENFDTHRGTVTAFIRVSPARPSGSVLRLV